LHQCGRWQNITLLVAQCPFDTTTVALLASVWPLAKHHPLVDKVSS